MRVGIPGTNIGFDLDVPDPGEYARDMLGKVQTFLESIKNTILGFAINAATKIGDGFRSMISDLPSQIFNGIRDAVRALWNAVRGQS